MIGKLQTVASTVYLKIRHPWVKTNGFHAVRPGTEIRSCEGGKISIGRSVLAKRRVTLSVVGGTLSVGNNVSFNRGDIIVCKDKVIIGDCCAFGPNVVIYDHDHSFDRQGFASGEYRTAPVIIGNRCWIGANVTILRGTEIGEGSIIGAGTIVKGIIPPHSLVTGSRELQIQPIEK